MTKLLARLSFHTTRGPQLATLTMQHLALRLLLQKESGGVIWPRRDCASSVRASRLLFRNPVCRGVTYAFGVTSACRHATAASPFARHSAGCHRAQTVQSYYAPGVEFNCLRVRWALLHSYTRLLVLTRRSTAAVGLHPPDRGRGLSSRCRPPTTRVPAGPRQSGWDLCSRRGTGPGRVDALPGLAKKGRC